VDQATASCFVQASPDPLWRDYAWYRLVRDTQPDCTFAVWYCDQIEMAELASRCEILLYKPWLRVEQPEIGTREDCSYVEVAAVKAPVCGPDH
jgi:hypothetical protein